MAGDDINRDMENSAWNRGKNIKNKDGLLTDMNFFRHAELFITAIVTVSFITACSPDSKEVARYKYGAITRAEVKQRAHGAKLNPGLEKTLIESIAVEGMARHDALAAGYDKNEIYMLRLEMETWPVLKKLVNEKNRERLNRAWEYVKCRHMAFSAGSTPESKNRALGRAGNVITLLKKGAKFDSLLKSYSSDPVNAVSVNTVYVLKGYGDPVFEKAAFSLTEGSYTSEPVVLHDGSAAVIIADEKGALTADNLGKKVTVPSERKRIASIIDSALYNSLVAEIEKNSNGQFKVKELPDRDDAVLFSVSGKDYTLRDLKKRRDLFSTIIREPVENRKFLLGFAKDWYFSVLYRLEAGRKGYVNDKKFAAELKRAAGFILANDYIRYVCESDITVSEKDMLDEYNKHKNHYMKMPETKSRKMVQLSYNDAKIFVKKNLVQSRVAAAMDAWRKKALAESGLVIMN